MKRWVLVLVWFALQCLWNFVFKTSADHVFAARLLVAVESMLAPIQILVWAVALLIIWKVPLKRQPLA